ncbi:MAG: hypothetical protein AAF754_00360 [Pseudomonadota bacterium]
MDYGVALLVFGILLLLLGLVGQIKAKELEVGTGHPVVRTIVGVLGVGLITLSLLISPVLSALTDITQTFLQKDDTPPRLLALDPKALDASPEPKARNDQKDLDKKAQDAAISDPKDITPAVETSSDAKALSGVSALVIAASSASGAQYTSFFKDHGAQIDVISTDQLQSIGIKKPDVVFVAADTYNLWRKTSARSLRTILRQVRIFGFGNGGADMFEVLGADIGRGSSMHGRGKNDIRLVNTPSQLKDPGRFSSAVDLYTSSRADVLGIYDDGSPSIANLDVFARWPTHSNHWTIVKQGNLFLWGYDAPVRDLTSEGKALLVSMIKHHVQSPLIPFETLLPEKKLTKPGTYSELLTNQFSSQAWFIEPHKAGAIRAEVTFSPDAGQLAVILNGPGQVGRFARSDGGSPLNIAFNLTPELASREGPWKITVQKFGTFDKAIPFHIRLDYPR